MSKKTFIASLNDYHKNLSDLCIELGKICLNGENFDRDDDVWLVKTKDGITEINLSVSYFKYDSTTYIHLGQFILKEKKFTTTVIHVVEGRIDEENYILPCISFTIDNTFYIATICGNQMSVEKRPFI